MKHQLTRGYYYLVPLWFLIEAAVFPGLRAGPLVGRSGWGLVAFYGVEAGIAAAFWRGIPGANTAALAENIAILVAVIRFIVVTPLDISLGWDGNSQQVAQASDMAHDYVRLLPSAISSGFHVVATLGAAVGLPAADQVGAVDTALPAIFQRIWDRIRGSLQPPR